MSNLFLDIAAGSVAGESIVLSALTATGAGSPVDLVQSNGNMASALLQVGSVVGDTPVVDVKLQQSNSTASGFADIPNATFTTITTSGTTAAGAVQVLSFQRQKRYVRAYATASGITSTVLGVSVFGPAASAPPNNGGWSDQPAGMPTSPSFVSGTVSANGTTFTAVFSEAVRWMGGYAAVTSGAKGGALTYVSGDGTTTLVFTIASTIYVEDVAVFASSAGTVIAPGSGNPNAATSNVVVTNNSTQDDTAPTLTTATVAANGTTFTLVFSEAVQTFAGGANGFTITATGGAATVGYTSGTGTTTIIFTVNRTISTGETVTTTYTPGTIADAAGNLLAAIVARATVNNSAQP